MTKYAFPHKLYASAPGELNSVYPGMTLREWYAGLAMHAFLVLEKPYTYISVAEEAVKAADRLIEQLGSE